MASVAFVPDAVILSASSSMTPTEEDQMATLFDRHEIPDEQRLELAEGAVLLKAFALKTAPSLLSELDKIRAISPFRRMVTPGGFEMSIEMTNCGPLGWITDRAGYRYAATDPLSNALWPAMPAAFAKLAKEAAFHAGYPDFTP